MKRMLVGMLAIAAMATQVSGAQWYRGEANGWGVSLMTDNGDGTHSITINGAANTRTAWKVSDNGDSGDWSSAWPMSGDSWGYYNGAGQLTITFDTNTYSDGWAGNTRRHEVDHDTGSTWQPVGDFNGWNNNDPALYMTDLGGGVREGTAVIANPGNYLWKAVMAGSWDAIGYDARSVNADNIPFTTTVPNELVIFQVDVLRGIARIVPEPATMAMLGIGAMALIRRRRH